MKKISFIVALLVVVSFADTTTSSIVIDSSSSGEPISHIQELKKPHKKENKLLSAVIMMLFVGVSMGIVGNMNPR